MDDIALILTAIAGFDRRSPISIAEPANIFAGPLSRDFKNVRIAWSMDIGGLPVDPEVTRVIDAQRHTFEDLGCIPDEASPDFSDADEIFQVWRAWHYDLMFAELLREHRGELKDTVVWNIEKGMKLTGPEIGTAERKRTALYHRIREFMETYEYIILPVSQVPPFDLKQRYIEEINGVKMNTYIDWMKSCYYISTIGNPAISVPCGFTSGGLPVGLQIVGRHQDDLGVLKLAHAFENATGFGKKKPPLV
jgi:amidase